MENMPSVHRKFDPTRVLKEPALRSLGFAPIGDLIVVNGKLKINLSDPIAAAREFSIYAFVASDEVVRIGHSDGPLRTRMRQWENDINKWLGGFVFRAPTQNDEAACLKALLDKFRVAKIFAKPGRKDEEHSL